MRTITESYVLGGNLSRDQGLALTERLDAFLKTEGLEIPTEGGSRTRHTDIGMEGSAMNYVSVDVDGPDDASVVIATYTQPDEQGEDSTCVLSTASAIDPEKTKGLTFGVREIYNDMGFKHVAAIPQPSAREEDRTG